MFLKMIQHDITSNSSINLLLSITFAIIGNILGGIGTVAVPIIIMQFFQILAWFSAFVIMLITVYKTLKEQKEKKKG
jgi:hypothetical protein